MQLTPQAATPATPVTDGGTLAPLCADQAISRLNITKDQLEAALLQWELQHRSGETRTYAETQCMPPEIVAAESASNLWCALGDAL